MPVSMCYRKHSREDRPRATMQCAHPLDRACFALAAPDYQAHHLHMRKCYAGNESTQGGDTGHALTSRGVFSSRS